MIERFDCDVLCSQQQRGRDVEWVDDRRAERGCTRIDIPPVEWDVAAVAIHRGGWMGRAPVRETEQFGIKISPRHPTELPTEGCPGGWYRSRFVASVLPYMRRRDDHGGRVQNHLLDRADDDLIYQLIAYAEEAQESSEAHMMAEVQRG